MSKREITKEEEKKILKVIKENEKLKKENEKLKKEIIRLKEVIDEYIDDIKQFKEVRDRMFDEYDEEIIQLKEAVDEYDEENDDLRGKIKSLEEDYDDLKKENKELLDETNDDLRDKIKRLESDYDNEKRKWESLLEEYNSEAERAAEAETDLEDLRQELNDLRLEKNQELIQNIKNMPRIQYPYSKYDPVKFPSSTIHKKNRLETEIDDDVIDELMETYTTEKQNIFLDHLKAQDFIPFKGNFKKSKKLEEEELEDFEL